MRFQQKWKNSVKDTWLTYQSWKAMRNRCLFSNNQAWDNYGGRGITICAQWRDNYDAFYADMGPRLTGTTLERLDNDKGYGPGNCIWATNFVQRRNTRQNRILVVDGTRKILKDIAKESGIHRATLASRLDLGMTVETALGLKHYERRRAGLQYDL